MSSKLFKPDNIEIVLAGEEKEKNALSEQTVGWFKKISKGIKTDTVDKKETPDGLWYKCNECGYTCLTEDLSQNMFVCTNCNKHHRIGSKEYFDILFDNQEYTFLFDNIKSKDFLQFVDLKPYHKRLKEMEETEEDLKDSIRVAHGLLKKHPIVIACMDFNFIGGSLGSVMGEKIARAVDFCIENKMPFLIISKSGGARMMESAFSLMQMPKTCAKLTQLAEHKLPYISLLTDPTFGGVSASFAMLGDFNIAEPNALIGFAGPRVVKEAIKKDLPKEFQRSEFLLERGFLDFIIDRKELKDKLADLLFLLKQ